MTHTHTSTERAADLLMWLEQHGAIARLVDDAVRVDLNGVPGLNFKKADKLSRQILALRAELRGILRSRRVLH